MTVLALLLSVPFGVGAAIYLVEYAKGKQVSRDHPCDGGDTFRYSFYYLWTLWYVVFVTALKWGYSMMAGAATLAIMVLPVIMRTTEEALLCVPDSFREEVSDSVQENCVPYLKLCFRVRSGYFIRHYLSDRANRRRDGGTHLYIRYSCKPCRIFDSGRTLAIHMYSLSREGMHTNEAYATAVVLLIVVLIINGVSS